MAQAKDLPHRRGRRRVGSWGACERLPNLKRGQRHYLVKILFGFPPEIFRAVVVHELFHAWLGENGLSDRFKPDTCEWLCEHMSCLYLSESGAGKPWRQVIAMSRDYYRYWRAREYKGMTSSQIVQALKK